VSYREQALLYESHGTVHTDGTLAAAAAADGGGLWISLWWIIGAPV
jgi:hypothetical protein